MRPHHLDARPNRLPVLQCPTLPTLEPLGHLLGALGLMTKELPGLLTKELLGLLTKELLSRS